MSKFSNRLDHVKVAAPCPANWDEMSGNDRVRFCTKCNLKVYNLSGMSRNEAERLVNRTEDRLCIRYYRRADGAILTDNCPVGLRALKRRAKTVVKAVLSSVLCFLTGVGLLRVAPSPADREMVTGAIAEREAELKADRVVVMGSMVNRESGRAIKPLSPDLAVTGKLIRKKGVAARGPGL
jgi:hypothetical protein